MSPREAVEDAIARIEKQNPSLNAVIATRFEEALAEVDTGLPDGPLRGVPVLIKDLNMSVAGLPSSRGSRLFADDIPDHDSELVARYKRAGMVVLGTTNSPEFGLNASTEPLLHGPTRNPRDLTRSTGGSSGGAAAAVAAGPVPVAHASDGGGSIRIPASMNGLFGLKPSRGRVTTAPAPSTLSAPASVHHAVTTTVRDSALLLDISSVRVAGTVIGVPAPAESFAAPAARPPGRLRIGLTTSFIDGPETDPDVVAAVEDAAQLCASLGHTVVPVKAQWVPGDVSAATAPLMGIAFTTAVRDRLAELGRDLRDDDLEPFTRILFDHYVTMPATALSRALSAAQRVGWQVGATFEEYDVLLTPALACRVPPARIARHDPTGVDLRARRDLLGVDQRVQRHRHASHVRAPRHRPGRSADRRAICCRPRAGGPPALPGRTARGRCSPDPQHLRPAASVATASEIASARPLRGGTGRFVVAVSSLSEPCVGEEDHRLRARLDAVDVVAPGIDHGARRDADTGCVVGPQGLDLGHDLRGVGGVFHGPELRGELVHLGAGVARDVQA
nr:amidase family protein [Nocardioides sp. B-3]